MPVKLWIKLKNHFRNRSGRAWMGDGIFYLLILLLLIPGPRQWIATSVKRMTLFSPGLKLEEQAPLIVDWDWPLRDLSDKTINFQDYQGSVLFVNTWATWCPPCRAEMPSIERLYQKMGKQVGFLLVSQEDISSLQAFVQQHGYEMPVYSSAYAPPALLQSNRIPATFIIDKNGRVIYKHLSAARWDSDKVEQLLTGLLAD